MLSLRLLAAVLSLGVCDPNSRPCITLTFHLLQVKLPTAVDELCSRECVVELLRCADNSIASMDSTDAAALLTSLAAVAFDVEVTPVVFQSLQEEFKQTLTSPQAVHAAKEYAAVWRARTSALPNFIAAQFRTISGAYSRVGIDLRVPRNSTVGQ